MTAKVVYTYLMGRRDNVKDISVRVEFDRPDWWADATRFQREELEVKALTSDQLTQHYMTGYSIKEVFWPVCECIVQALPAEDRDPYYQGATNSCKRCGGPLPS